MRYNLLLIILVSFTLLDSMFPADVLGQSAYPPPLSIQAGYPNNSANLWTYPSSAPQNQQGQLPPGQVQIPEYSSEAFPPAGHSLEVDPVQYTQQHQNPEIEEFNPPVSQLPPTQQQQPETGLIFKNGYHEVGWIIGNGDHLGITTLKASQTFGFGRIPLLSMTPEFAVNFFNGPDHTDLPGEVFSTGLKINWFQPLSKQWQALVSVTPGYYSDFHSSEDAIRMSGMGLVFYKCTPELTLVMGVVYTSRDDVRIIPAVGLTYKPNDQFKLDVTFPKPKISWRTSAGDDGESWNYVAGEFGGGTWAVRREDGRDDLLTLRDYRLLYGWEQKDNDGNSNFFELGYVFSRRVEYQSGLGDYDPKSAFLLRAGWNF